MLMTPRGLKIRLEVPHAFCLIARLWSVDRNTDAFRVLNTCEGLENITSLLSVIGGTIAVILGPSYWYVVVGIVAGALIGRGITALGLYFIPGLPTLGILWSWIAGYGVITLVGIGLGWWLRDWRFGVAWFGGVVASFILSMWIIEPIGMKRYKAQVGYPLTQAEINFFNSYRLHADRLGVTRNIVVSDEETNSGTWQECLQDYATKYPDAVARFIG